MRFHTSLDADATVAYDGAEVQQTTRLGDMAGSSPSDILVLTIHQTDADAAVGDGEDNVVRRPQDLQVPAERYCLSMVALMENALSEIYRSSGMQIKRTNSDGYPGTKTKRPGTEHGRPGN